MRMNLSFAGFLAFIAISMWSAAAFADQTPANPALPSPPSSPEKLALSDDGASRLTIPVTINGQGPFPFIIDTGADRTVISRELAATLNLPSGPHVSMHDSAGVEDEETAVIERLDVGKRSIANVNAPLLAERDLGAMGMLGIDSLRDQHVVMDFKAREMSSSPSHEERYDPNLIVVKGRSRFGQLVLVDAIVRGVRVWVILDSGAQSSVGNLALRKLLTRNDVQHGQYPITNIISVTGHATPAEMQDIPEAHIGGLTIRNMPLVFAQLHTFDRFGLTDKPAMLLGMDVLSTCRRVTVDFKRREATFSLR
jgi:predicted aspartyl protease